MMLMFLRFAVEFTADFSGERLGLFLSVVIVQFLGLAPLKLVEDFSSKNLSVKENLSLLLAVF